MTELEELVQRVRRLEDLVRAALDKTVTKPSAPWGRNGWMFPWGRDYDARDGI